jgi:hypothetical protein
MLRTGHRRTTNLMSPLRGALPLADVHAAQQQNIAVTTP